MPGKSIIKRIINIADFFMECLLISQLFCSLLIGQGYDVVNINIRELQQKNLSAIFCRDINYKSFMKGGP
jgi:hypothetical protein